MQIKDLLENWPIDPVVIRPQRSVSEAVSLMGQRNIGILVVVDEAQKIIGVISERDIIISMGKKANPNFADAKVCDLMNQQVVTCNPDDSVVDGIYVLNKAGFRHLVVAQDGKPVGVLSMRDILKNIAPLLLESKNRHEEQLLVKFLQALKAA